MPPAAPPPPVRVRQARADTTRAGILGAATRVFAAVGFAGARTDTIAAAAGVNKALLYYYFQSKEGLYTAVFEHQFHRFHAEALARLQAAGPARTVLHDYLDWHFTTLAQLPGHAAALHHQFLSASGRLRLALLRKYGRPRLAALEELLARGIAAREFRDVDVRHTAISINSLVIHYFSIRPVLESLGFADAFSPRELARRQRSVLDLVNHALLRPSHLSPS